MNLNLTPDRLELIADACDFYAMYLAQQAALACEDAKRLADNASTFEAIAEFARSAAEVQ